MKLAIANRESEIEKFIGRCAEKDVAEEVCAHLYVLGIVKVCGYIERSIEAIIIERLNKRAHPKVLQFIKSDFRKGRNFKCPAIKSYLERFDVDWAKSFDKWLKDNEAFESAINSAYDLRNSAAHGNSANVGSKKVKDCFAAAKAAIAAVVEATKK